MIAITKIVSGGQTGADRAALDWAIENLVPHGGWCPAGRRAEDGCIAARYELQEARSSNYVVRTEWNVRDSDGTAIFTLASILSGGSKRTQDLAMKHRKPCVHLNASDPVERCAQRLAEFVAGHSIRVLNVAGSRASKEPDVGAFVRAVLSLTSPKMPCPFCQIDESRFLVVRPRARAIRDSFPVSPGHTLIVPVRHVASIFDLDAGEQAEIWELVSEVRAQVQQRFEPAGFTIGINDGEAAGQTVQHAHVHLIPRYSGDRPDPRGGIRWVLPKAADYWSERE